MDTEIWTSLQMGKNNFRSMAGKTTEEILSAAK